MQRILQDHYKDHCKWFAPVELVRRLLLPIFIVIDPGNLVSKPILCTSDNMYNDNYIYVHVLILKPCASIYTL